MLSLCIDVHLWCVLGSAGWLSLNPIQRNSQLPRPHAPASTANAAGRAKAQRGAASALCDSAFIAR